MKNKKVLFIGGIIATSIVVLVVVLFLKNNVFASAKYTNDYNRTFGEFTAKTTEKLLGEVEENTCYSPVSLYAALALAAEVTEDDTRKELIEALGVENISELEKMYETTLANLEVEDKGSKLTLCNSFWVDKDNANDEFDSLSKALKDTMSCEMYSEVDPVKVNEWVDTNTNHMIEKVLDEDLQYALALVNTLYYKSAWKNTFSDIGEADFYLQDGNKVLTEFIKNKSTMKYSEGDDYSIVNVPMDEGEMVFVLPDEGIKLSKLMKERSLNKILSFVTGDDMNEGLVSITIPKYEISYNYSDDLKNVVESLGAKKIFSDDCDWIVLDNVPPADIIQKVKFVLDENGVEAAAATLISATYGKNTSETDLELELNRPFIYILMKDDVPLFIGTVYNPAEK